METVLFIECPITHEPIKTIGITCWGNVYEYDAIVKWLSENDSDPLTNQFVFTKTIKKIPITISQTELENHVSNVRKSYSEYSNHYRISWTKEENRLKKYRKLDVSQFVGLAWFKFNEFKIKKIFDDAYLDEYYRITYTCTTKADMLAADEKTDSIKRPSKTGWGFQFLTFHDLEIPKRKYNFKNTEFDMAKFSNVTFKDCTFWDSSFVGCEFDNVQFVRCEFGGLNLCFVGSVGKPTFIACKMYPLHHEGSPTSEKSKVEKILEWRKLENFTVISHDSFC